MGEGDHADDDTTVRVSQSRIARALRTRYVHCVPRARRARLIAAVPDPWHDEPTVPHEVPPALLDRCATPDR